MTGAGDMRERLRFEQRIEGADEYGNTVTGEFAVEFTVAAQITRLKGGETVMAARLAGSQPVIIRVWRTTETRRITVEWRAVDVATGDVYNLTSPPADMEGRRRFLDILATAAGPA